MTREEEEQSELRKRRAIWRNAKWAMRALAVGYKWHCPACGSEKEGYLGGAICGGCGRRIFSIQLDYDPVDPC